METPDPTAAPIETPAPTGLAAEMLDFDPVIPEEASDENAPESTPATAEAPASEPSPSQSPDLAQVTAAAVASAMAPVLAAMNALVERVQAQPATGASAADVPPWERDASSRAVALARAELGFDVAPALAQDYAEQARRIEDYSRYVDHEEHGARAKQEIAQAKARLVRVRALAQEHHERGALEKRLERLEQAPKQEQFRQELAGHLTADTLVRAGYPTLGRLVGAGAMTADRLIGRVAIDVADRKATLSALDERLADLEDALAAAAADVPKAADKATSSPPNPGLISIPQAPRASAEPERYSTLDDLLAL